MAGRARRVSPRRGEAGYNLVVLVMVIAVMNILVAAALPLWSQAIRRDKEEELIFRGLQYAEALRVFHNRFQRWPTRLQELVEVKPRCIRQLWKDPMTEDGKWQLIFEGREGLPIGVPGQPGQPTQPGQPGQNGQQIGLSNPPNGRGGGLNPANPGDAGNGIDQEGHSIGPIKGVYSRSSRKSILIWSGRQQYDEWRFNVDLLTGAGRAGGNGFGVPQGAPGAPAGQANLSVRWIGRPMRSSGGLNTGLPGGVGSATPGSPGLPRGPQPGAGGTGTPVPRTPGASQ
jgi:type II secretory pathway pseudopilin PulG